MTKIGHMKPVDAPIEEQTVSQRVIESDISGTTASDALSGWVSDPLRYTNPGVGRMNAYSSLITPYCCVAGSSLTILFTRGTKLQLCRRADLVFARPEPSGCRRKGF